MHMDTGTFLLICFGLAVSLCIVLFIISLGFSTRHVRMTPAQERACELVRAMGDGTVAERGVDMGEDGDA